MATDNGRSNELHSLMHGNTMSTQVTSAHNEEQDGTTQANASTDIPDPQQSQHFQANDTTAMNDQAPQQEVVDPPFLSRHVSLSEASDYEDFYEDTISEESDYDNDYDSYDSQASDYESEFSEEEEEDLQRHSSVIAIGIPSVEEKETIEEEEETFEKERYKTPEEATLEKVSVAVALDMAETEHNIKHKAKDTSQYTMVARLPPVTKVQALDFDENAKPRAPLQESDGDLKPRASLGESDGDLKPQTILQDSDGNVKPRLSLVEDSDVDLKRQASLQDSDADLKRQASLQDSDADLKRQASLQDSDVDLKRQASLQDSDVDLKRQASLQDSDADLKRQASLQDSDADLKRRMSLGTLKQVAALYADETELIHGGSNVHGQEDDDEEGDLEAQAGIPLVLPGAFAMEGMGASEGLEGQVTGYDSGFDNSDSDTEEQFHQTPLAREEPEEEPVELEAELHPEYHQSQRMLLDGIALQDDELPHVQQVKVPMKVRLIQGTILITALAAVGAIIGVVVSLQGGGSSNPSDSSGNLMGWEQAGDSLRGTQTAKDGSFFGSAVSLSANGTRLVVNSPGWDESPSRLDIGQAIVYDWSGESWEQVGQKLDGPGPRTTTTGSLSLSQSVALSKDGTRVAFGSPDWNGGQVAVWEESSTNTWTTVGQNLTGAVGEKGRFGYAVALSSDGTVVAAGSPFAVTTSGQEAIGVARIFAESTNSTWAQRGQDLLGEGEFELNGWSVALSANGSRVAVGSPGSGIGSFTGAVRAFEFNGTAWTPLGQMINGDSIQDKFGHSVSLSDDGTILAVGGWEKPGPANSIYVGHVRVYKYTQDDWVQLGGDMVGTESYDNFGYSVSLSASGMQVAVGSPRSNSISVGIPPRGSISVYEFDGSMWKRQQGALGGSQDFENLGHSVSLSAGRVAGGSPYASFDGKYNNVGMAAVYQPIGA